MEGHTLGQLIHRIIDIPEVENGAGFIVDPELLVVDTKGNNYKLDCLYLRGDNKIIIRLGDKLDDRD